MLNRPNTIKIVFPTDESFELTEELIYSIFKDRKKSHWSSTHINLEYFKTIFTKHGITNERIEISEIKQIIEEIELKEWRWDNDFAKVQPYYTKEDVRILNELVESLPTKENLLRKEKFNQYMNGIMTEIDDTLDDLSFLSYKNETKGPTKDDDSYYDELWRYKRREHVLGKLDKDVKRILSRGSVFSQQAEMKIKSPEEKLYDLCWDNNMEKQVIKLLSEQPIDVNKKFFLDDTCLIRASRKGHLNLVRILLENGAIRDLVDTMGHTASYYAASKEIKDLIDNWPSSALNQSSVPNSPPKISSEEKLYDLCWYANKEKEVAKLLSEHSVDINKLFSLDDTCLMRASRKGHLNLVRILLENGANRDLVDIRGNTASYYAVSKEIKDLIDNWPSTKLHSTNVLSQRR